MPKACSFENKWGNDLLFIFIYGMDSFLKCNIYSICISMKHQNENNKLVFVDSKKDIKRDIRQQQMLFKIKMSEKRDTKRIMDIVVMVEICKINRKLFEKIFENVSETYFFKTSRPYFYCTTCFH